LQLDPRRYRKTAHRWHILQYLVVSVTRTRTLWGFDTFIPNPLPPRATLLHDVQRSVDVPGSHSRQFRGLGGVAGAKAEQVVGDKQLGEGQRTALMALDTVREDTDALGVWHADQAHLGLYQLLQRDHIAVGGDAGDMQYRGCTVSITCAGEPKGGSVPIQVRDQAGEIGLSQRPISYMTYILYKVGLVPR